MDGLRLFLNGVPKPTGKTTFGRTYTECRSTTQEVQSFITANTDDEILCWLGTDWRWKLARYHGTHARSNASSPTMLSHRALDHTSGKKTIWIGVGIWGWLLGHGFVAVKWCCLAPNTTLPIHERKKLKKNATKVQPNLDKGLLKKRRDLRRGPSRSSKKIN